MSSTNSEKMQQLVEEYRQKGMAWPATKHAIAEWAVKTRRVMPPQEAMIDHVAEMIAVAMREEFITDPQGRRVRAKHAARIKRNGVQLVLWDDIRTADPQHMLIAFQQRRQQIVGDCRQLKTDVDSYNDNAKPPAPIQMIFDFTDDLAELEALERSPMASAGV